MKTKILINILTPKERKIFEENVIKKHKRKSLQKLYDYVKKNKNIDKDKLSPILFDSIYSAKQDVLIRNELRLLNKELETFLAEKQWLKALNKNSCQADVTLLKVYLERQEFSLFEQTWRKTYKQIIKEQLYDLQAQMTVLFLEYKIAIAEVSLDCYQEINTLLQEGLQAIASQGLETYKKLELKYAFVQRTLYVLNPTRNMEVLAPYLKVENNVAVSEDFRQYVDYIIQGYLLEGLEKIDVFTKATAIAQTLMELPKYRYLEGSIIMTKATIALEYFHLEQYKAASELLATCLENIALIPKNNRAPVVFNYLSTLIFLEKHQIAIDFYQDQHNLFEQAPALFYKATYSICWAYMLSNQHDLAINLLLQHVSRERPENDYLYGRLLLGVVYCDNQDLELAERAFYNFNQSCRYKAPVTNCQQELGKVFYQYTQALHLIDKEKFHQKLERIQKNLNAIIDPANTSKRFYKWLNDNIELHLNK